MPQQPTTPTTLQIARRLITISASLTLLLSLGLRYIHPLRGPVSWRWSLNSSENHENLPVLLLIYLVLFIFWRLIWGRTQRLNGWHLFGVALLTFSLSVMLLMIQRDGLGRLWQIIESPIVTSHYTSALAIDSPLDFLDNPAAYTDRLASRSRTHGPGALLFFWIFQHYFSTTTHSAAIISGLALILLMALSTIPFYLFAVAYTDAPTANIAIILYSLTPTLLLFSPTLNQAYLLLITLSLLFWHRGLTRQNIAYSFMAGCVLSIGAFSNIVFYLPGAIIGLTYLNNGEQNNFRSDWWQRINWRSGTSYAIGLIFIQAIVSILFGVDWLQAQDNVLNSHQGFTGYRPYLTWLIWNHIDFFIFLGVFTAGGFAGYVIVNLKDWYYRRYNGDKLFVSFLIVYGLFSLTGIIRGETARLYLPLLPFVVIGAAQFLRTYLPQKSRDFMLALLILQMAFLTFVATQILFIGFAR